MPKRFLAKPVLAKCLSVVVFGTFVLTTVYFSTLKRTSSPPIINQKLEVINPSSVPLSARAVDPQKFKPPLPQVLASPISEEELMWCKILEYKDLSNHHVFQDFNQWIKLFQELNCSTSDDCFQHDPRLLHQLVNHGLSLSRARAEILTQVIRADPRAALNLAIPPQTINQLPQIIQNEMENWESSFVDISSLHKCFTSYHPGGYVETKAKFEDGRTLRAWTYGARKKLPIRKGLAVWGISLGEDFAISEEPVRLLDENTDAGFIEFGGQKISYNGPAERRLLVHEIKKAERKLSGKSGTVHRIKYPVALGSTLTSEAMLSTKYELNTSRVTFDEALSAAIAQNAHLLQLEDSAENKLITDWLKEKHDDQMLFTGFDENNNSVSCVWLGLTDSEDQNGSIYDEENNVTTLTLEINASEGNWTWLKANTSSTFENWWGGFPSNATAGHDFAALDWNTSEGNWTDFNLSARLPFVIEKDFEFAKIESDLKGIRKVLVVPGRFVDETIYYQSHLSGSNISLTNDLGEEILSELQNDPYEPISREVLVQAMNEVRDFYLRNSDNELDIIPVISSTVTIPHLFGQFRRYLTKAPASGPANQYDSDGSLTTTALNVRLELSEEDPAIENLTISAAAEASEDWNPDGPAFVGLSSLALANPNSPIDTNFTSPPTVTISGGEALNDSGFPHPRFEPAEAEATLDASGDVIGIKLLEPGSYYQTGSSPQILLNGVDYTSEFSVRVESILISRVVVTNYSAGAPGLGWIGKAGAHVRISNGTIPSKTIAHEMGHNFGLWHANRYYPKSEKVLSDDADVIEYGNPYSAMGTSPSIVEQGDFTIVEKVFLNLFFNGGGGYLLENSLGADVADLSNAAALVTSPLTEQSTSVPNTFRIYRSDTDSPPRALNTNNFLVNLPAAEHQFLYEDLNTSPYQLLFTGTGEEASGTLTVDANSSVLSISHGGRGFVSEPVIQVLDNNGTARVTLNPAWIRMSNGSAFDQQATLLSYAATDRWIRGVRVSTTGASQFRSLNQNTEGLGGTMLTDYYLSYRKDVSLDGLVMEITNDWQETGGSMETYLLDATPQTPNDFSDAHLSIGITYSDYDADIHITPISRGGSEEMPYIECVVNMGTVDSGEAQAPQFDLVVSNQTPSTTETIEIGAMVKDGNTSGYAYAWYIDEQPMVQISTLNHPLIRQQFSSPGQYVVRVVVSDMRGGVTSKNIIIQVKGHELSSLSSLSGRVQSSQGSVQGARVILEASPIINHQVSMTGNIFDSFFLDGENDPARFRIDGEVAPQLVFRRGEIHRFYFDNTLNGAPMSFLQLPENAPPRVVINMLANPTADEDRGSSYFRNPKVSYNFRSAFSTYYSEPTGTYLEMLQFLFDKNNTIAGLSDDNGTHLKLLEYLDDANLSSFERANHITMPFAKALMQETNVSVARVGPLEISELGYFTYGGRGYNRTNTPVVEVRRSSIWEDYTLRNANATALIDGVGTISPVNTDEFLGSEWATRPGDSVVPDLIVWGTGGGDSDDPYDEVNASLIAWTDDATGETMRTINLQNQGKGFEPNATMAVLHYPLSPKAFWTFDRHESLFEDSNQARYLPSPAWNREYDETNLAHYWKLDTNKSSTTMADFKGSVDLSSSEPIGEGNFSYGAMGHAFNLKNSVELSAVSVLDANFTYSMWVHPQSNFTFNLNGEDLVYASPTFTFGTMAGGGIDPAIPNYWTHVAVVAIESNATLFIDGRPGECTATFDEDIIQLTLPNSVLLDEIRIYDIPLSESEIRYLAGRTVLDLSGNKYHAVPMGPGSYLVSPGTGPSSSNVPADPAVPNSPNGSGRLGDSFQGEDHGHSISLNGTDQYLDLFPHSSEFPLTEGTISLWIKPSAPQDLAPLFTMATPYRAVLPDENASDYEISETGNIFSFELVNGWPKLSGSRAYLSNEKVPVNEWSHLVGAFNESGVSIWLNGTLLNLNAAGSQTQDRFAESVNLLNLASTAEIFAAGRSYSREDDPLLEQPSEIFFNGSIDDLAIYDRILTNTEVNYLYELRRGREQTPRLEAIVDAVGTVEISEGGEGYRENPDLVFWYGENKEFESNLTSFDSLANARVHFTDGNGDFNGTLGELIFIDTNDSSEAGVWSYHLGKDANRSYNWHKNNLDNDWRRHVSAQGFAEYDDASLGDVVWVKRLNRPVEVPLPDGRTVLRRYIEYVSLDRNRSLSLERNNTNSWPYSYYKPNGLYGFNERVDLDVGSPLLHNPDALDIYTADAFVHFYIDPDANESISIVDSGQGVLSIPEKNIKISGTGYRPATSTQSEQEHAGFAEIDTFTNDKIRAGSVEIYDWAGNEDVNISTMEFNKTFSYISVDDPGFGYAAPLEFQLIGGLPVQINNMLTTPLPEYNATVDYNFVKADFRVKTMGEGGSIEELEITNMGEGYINYDNLSEDDLEVFTLILSGKGYNVDEYPFISVTGGGGHGARFKAIIDDNGSITDTVLIDSGSGYINIAPNNFPRAVHNTLPLLPGEQNASLSVRLGGYIKEIPICTDCQNGLHQIAPSPYEYSHLAPWVEIWDRGRSEVEIDSSGTRAHAAAKVVNGKITKVIVTNSGAGYIDPIAIVRDAPPKHTDYYQPNDTFRRKWKCTFLRPNVDGIEEECGHIHWGLYPPEECPGETDELLPYQDENGSLWPTTGNDIRDWRERHDEIKEHELCAESDSHLNAKFLVRKCWGTKENYILHDNAIYRDTRTDWLGFEANLTIISENGKIREVVVDDQGSNYYSPNIHIRGTGSGVDAIPVFDESGLNTHVLFDDPRIKNIELDHVDRPIGAGQGFQERPWAWDETPRGLHKSSLSDSPYLTESNDPIFGYAERVDVITLHTAIDSAWNFGQPILADYLGDRILKVEVLDPGLYNSATDLNVTIEYNASGALDHDRDGSVDFIPTSVTAFSTNRLTKFVLDDNASYDDNSSDEIIERGLFTETPKIQILDKRNLTAPDGVLDNISYSTESLSSYIRLNGDVAYDPEIDKSYVELYIDDRFPSHLFYGIGVVEDNDSQTLPAFGGEILVSEGVPGHTWAEREALEKPKYSYADKDGYYAFGNLAPGMYNVAVFMEDQKFQESTFRPEANPSRISQFVYVPGFPELILETDSGGIGRSTLVWSRDARKRSIPEGSTKAIQGIGRGLIPA